MSNQLQLIETVEEEVEEIIPIEELNWFELPNGMPCFIGDVDNISKHVEANGYNFYYVLCNESYTYMDGKTSKTGLRPSLLKVVSTIISRSVTVADPNELVFDTMSIEAQYLLPRIPFSLVQMMEDFFRTVEEKHGTESIVLLTYDPDFLTTDSPGDGWGVLVPDQTNTAADCAYDHESVASQKPEHVYLVGSAHSHPGMAAFASGTDHKDQADFPGIHITYGWRKNVNNNATEYHIELQTPGSVFSMQPDQVFEGIPKPDPDPQINVWMDKVTKKAPPLTTSTGVGTGSSYTSGYGNYSSGSSYGGYSSTPKPKTITLPQGFPDPSSNVIIAELKTENEPECPFCNTAFIAPDYNKRRCLSCHQYIALPGETMIDITNVRKNQGLYSYDIDISKSLAKNVYMWSRLNGSDQIVLVQAADNYTSTSAGKF